MKLWSINNNSATQFHASEGYSRFTGSSSFKVVDGELYKADKNMKQKYERTDDRENINRIILTDKMALLQELRECDSPCGWMVQEIKKIESEVFTRKRQTLAWYWWNKNENVIPETPKRSNIRKLNKSKLRNKMFALFNLKESRKFIAFYSISFPEHFEDNIAFVAFNYWLTCLRKNYNLINYVWVTERQKNGTIHFHMLTNNYMHYKSINDEMGTIINNLVSKGAASWGNSSKEKYNGVDGDAIFNSKRHKKTGAELNQSQIRAWISRYITKYISKNDSQFTRACWHCSHTISQLFTNEVLTESEFQEIASYLPRDKKKYSKFESDYCTTYVFLFTPNQRILINIIQLNNLIYSMCAPPCHSVKGDKLGG